MSWVRIQGIVIRGHGVASGQAGDPRYPGGTLALQVPLFRERGLDLAGFYPGTLNVSVAPCRVVPRRARHTFRALRWAPGTPAEDFSFFDCHVLAPDGSIREGLVYYPHPETKPEHFQAPDVLEILAAFVPGLRYGCTLALELDTEQIGLEPDPAAPCP